MPDATPPAYDPSTFDWDFLSTIMQAGRAELQADGAFSPDKHKQPKKKLTSNVQSTSNTLTPNGSNSGGKNFQGGSSKNSQGGSSKNLGEAYSVAGAPSVTKTHRQPTQD